MRTPRAIALASSVVLATSLLLLLAACGTAEGNPAADGESAAPPALVGTSWTLVSYTDDSGAPVEATPSPNSGSLAFEGDGLFSGSTGCNRIMGTYEQDGSSLAMNPGRMRFDPCTGAVAAQETAVLAGFALVASFTADGQLLLKGADGSTLLTYDPTLTELAGTE